MTLPASTPAEWLACVLADPDLPWESKLLAAQMAHSAQRQPDGTWAVTVDDD